MSDSRGTGELLARFDAAVDVAEARTPPAEWYTDPRLLELERERVLAPTWQAVARRGELARAGDFVAEDVAGEPVVCVRGDDGELRALSNVCRHHAAPVAAGCGRAERLRCPYHGWSYGLDGRLASAPRMGGVRDFDREELRLPRLGVAEVGPLVLCRTAGGREGGRPPSDLEPVERELAGTGWDRLVFVERRRYELACNWKVYVDNYLDGGYHVPVLHADLARDLDLEGYATELLERGSVQRCEGAAAFGDAGTGRAGGASDRVGAGAVYAWLFPTLMVNRYGPWMDVNAVRPLSVDRTEVVFDWYAEPGVARGDPDHLAACLAASEAVQREDERICEAVQRGLASGRYDVGRYAPRVEHAMHHFHRLLAHALRGEA